MSKEVYIVLSHTGSMFSRLIKTYTRAEYTHASIALDKQLKEIYSFGRLNPNNPFIGGFVKEDIEDGTFAKYKETRSLIYSIQITDEQYNKLIRMLEQFKTNPELYSYSLRGVIALSLGINYENDHRFFCSQFVATLLHESHIVEFKKGPHKITPTDLLEEIKEYHLIYNGKIAYYPSFIDQMGYAANL